MLAEREQISIQSSDSQSILSTLTRLPPYLDVSESIGQLRAAGYVIAALTNGTLKSARAQLDFAGIAHAFDSVLSADEVRRYKPAPEPYLFAARQLDRRPDELMLVAAHAWDLAGAANAGLKTAFIARPRQVLDRYGSRPDRFAKNLSELAGVLVR